MKKNLSFKKCLKEDVENLSYSDKYKFLKNHDAYNEGGRLYWSRDVKVYDLGLTDEQRDKYFSDEFQNIVMPYFWEENADLAQDIYQVGRMGGHLILMDKDIDILNDFDLSYYPTYEEWIEGEDEDQVEDMNYIIDKHYDAVIDFDKRTDELVLKLKKKLDDFNPIHECIHSEYDDTVSRRQNHYNVETAHEFTDLDDTVPETRKYSEEKVEIDYDDEF